MSEHQCQHQDKIIEMHGDIKTLVAEFKSMNGSLRTTKQGFEEHKKESEIYRKKVDDVWAGIHISKWIIALLFGSGLLFNFFFKK